MDVWFYICQALIVLSVNAGANVCRHKRKAVLIFVAVYYPNLGISLKEQVCYFNYCRRYSIEVKRGGRKLV